MTNAEGSLGGSAAPALVPAGDSGAQHPLATALILDALRSNEGLTRAELSEATKLPRSSVSHTIRQLLAAGTVSESKLASSTGGRRPTVLRITKSTGVTRVAELGGRHATIGLISLDGEILASANREVDVRDGVESLLPILAEEWTALEAELPDLGEVRAVGIAVPGPVDSTGHVTGAARMPGWNGLPLIELLTDQFGLPALIENDARAAAVGEWQIRGEHHNSCIYVKAGTGVGAGWMSEGQLHRGDFGFAGDITHIRIHTDNPLPCSCGNRGCLETVGSGAAILRRLAEVGSPIKSTTALLEAAFNGDPATISLVREAGARIGEVLSGIINFLNPHRIVIGGSLSQMDALIAGIRSELYERCLPMSTGQLAIETSIAGAQAPLIGMSVLARQFLDSRSIA